LRGHVTKEKKALDYEKHEFECMTAETLPVSLKEDVEFLKKHPWVRKQTNEEGFMYDIKTGLLHKV
jgi:carbonic anhydrase